MNKKKYIIGVIIIIAVVLIIANLSGENSNSKNSLIEYKSVPRIELKNTLSYNYEDNLFYGLASGFIKFDNVEDQPKDFTQYYIIKALNELDENSNQIFLVDDIVAMDNLPPQSIGVEEYSKIIDTSSGVVLEDKYGNRIFISKISGEISTKDAGGDKTTLITTESGYRSFMKGFLK